MNRSHTRWAVVCTILLALQAGAATYYVDQHAGASDSNPGTQAQPWKTITKAQTTAQAGDHIYIVGGADSSDPCSIYLRSGVYGINPTRAGTAGNITIYEGLPGTTVIIRGNDTSCGIMLTNCSYTSFRHLKFEHFSAWADSAATLKADIDMNDVEFSYAKTNGVTFRNWTNITLKNVYVHDGSQSNGGIDIRTATNVTMIDCIARRIDDGDGGDGDSDGYDLNYITNLIAINCLAEDNGEDGFDNTCTGTFINCVSRNHGACGMKFWRRSGDSYADHTVTLINCNICSNGETGLKFSSGDTTIASPPIGNIYNCTLDDNGQEAIAWRAAKTSDSARISRITNTIISNNGTPGVAYYSIGVMTPAVNVVDVDHCLFHDNQYAPSGVNSNTNSVTGDPLFFGSDSGYFEVRTGSPAIDAGTGIADVNTAFFTYSAYLTKVGVQDKDGDFRPQGSAWDIGSDEYYAVPGNAAPVFTSAPQPPPYELTALEGQSLKVTFGASDPQGDGLIFFFASGATTGMRIDSATGVFTWTPDYDGGGNTVSPQRTYDVTVGVTNQHFAEPAAETTMRIVVGNVNRPPAYDGLARYTCVAGRPWMCGIAVSDPDGDPVSYTLTGTPAAMEFDSVEGTLSWTPAATEVGPHSANLTLSDGTVEMTRTVVFEVLPEQPYVAPSDEAQIFYVDGVRGSDAQDGQTAATAWKTLSKAAATLHPGQMALVRAGTYNETVTYLAGNAGQPIIYKAYPGETPIADGNGLGTSPKGFRLASHNVCDGFVLRNYETAFDLRFATNDTTIVNCVVENASNYGIYGFSGDGLRVENVQLRNVRDRGVYGTGTNIHLYQTTVDTAGDRCICIYGATVDNVTVQNSEICHAGRYGVILGGQNALVQNTRIHDNAQIGAELDARYNFFVDSSVWNTTLFGGAAYNLRFMAAGSKSIVRNSIIVGSARYGIYVGANATVTVKDSVVSDNTQLNTLVASGGTLASESVLSSNAQNHPPVFAALSDQSVDEKSLLRFSISATDADGDALTFSAVNLPLGAAFDAAPQTFSWTPTSAQSGIYLAAFRASDGQASTSQVVRITVADIPNRAPVLGTLSNQTIAEGVPLQFSVSATDPDGDSLTYSATGLPTGAVFTDQVFSWTPVSGQAGDYQVSFAASDGQVTTSQVVTLTVIQATAVTDRTAPAVGRCSPANGDIQAALNTLVCLGITDAGSGVDGDSIVIRVNGAPVYSGNVNAYTSASGRCGRTGTEANYTFFYQPDKPFDFDKTVTVTVNAADHAGNAMGELTYTFTTEMRAFGKNQLVSAADAYADSKPVTVRDPAGNVWVAWEDAYRSRRKVYVARLAAGSASFGIPIRVSFSSSDQRHPAIATTDSGDVYVVWQDNRNGNWDIYGWVRPEGVSTGKEFRITRSRRNEVSPAIAIDHSSSACLRVAWQDNRNGNEDIYLASTVDSIATFVETRVTSDAADQTDPALAIDGDNTAYVLWTDMRNGNTDIYGASSMAGAGGSAWTNVPVVTGTGDQGTPAVAVSQDSTTLHMLWVDNSGGNSDIRYASSEGLPGNPVVGVDVSDDTANADQVAPALVGSAGGRVFACWQDSRHADASGVDTDLYLAELRAGAAGTNVFVGDDSTGSSQSEPALGVDRFGEPYVVWTDARSSETEIYYAATTLVDPNAIDARLITTAAGGTVGTDPAAITGTDDVSIVVPAGACPVDVRISISQILNPPISASDLLGGYDFGPSGIEFAVPVTVTIPYAVASTSGQVLPYWYDSVTAALSQQGITQVQNITISSRLNALQFQTTHFTPYYLVGGSTDAASTGGGGGGGCALAAHGETESPWSCLLPYVGVVVTMVLLRRRDRKAAPLRAEE